MTKDAEKLLRFLVDTAKEQNAEAICIHINEISDIPNIHMSRKALCEELKNNNCVSKYYLNSGGEIDFYLTTDGLEYFEEKEGRGRMEENKNVAIHVHGGQVNLASGNAVINATQNNGVNPKELNDIVNGILGSLSELDREKADEVTDIVEMAKEELERPEPRKGRLKSCITLIAPMFTIANGIPTLAENLHRLYDFILAYIW